MFFIDAQILLFKCTMMRVFRVFQQAANDRETSLRTFSGLPKDQALPCCFHYIFRHGVYVVDLQNTLDLHQETVNHAKVASCNAHNRGESFLVGKIIHADMYAQMIPALFEEPSRPVLREHMKLMYKSHARIQLGVARQAFFQSWLANED